MRCFNPRTRVGCDIVLFDTTIPHTGFNPRTRVGCDDPFVKDFTGRSWFQSTHPRGVRPFKTSSLLNLEQVSIHAPAWGATQDNHCQSAYERFQSTHPRGVRHCGEVSSRDAGCCFNPRTRVGCDIVERYHQEMQDAVSIHAPAWGATHAERIKQMFPESFNPRTRVGCDLNLQVGLHEMYWFQSTHPRGVRPTDDDRAGMFSWVSIHAPAWGATRLRFAPTTTSLMFQSTHPRGVRPQSNLVGINQ